MRTLVIGGARSGKSTTAERMLAGAADVTYVATGYPVDPADREWAARVATHQARRPASWATVETADLGPVLAGEGGPVLVDCLTLWLTRALDAAGAWDLADASALQPDAVSPVRAAVDGLVSAVAGSRRELVLVTNEVGQGVVPATAAGRLFRDQMGMLNAAVASVCDDVLWCVAGRTVRL